MATLTDKEATFITIGFLFGVISIIMSGLAIFGTNRVADKTQGLEENKVSEDNLEQVAKKLTRQIGKNAIAIRRISDGGGFLAGLCDKYAEQHVKRDPEMTWGYGLLHYKYHAGKITTTCEVGPIIGSSQEKVSEAQLLVFSKGLKACEGVCKK